MDNRDMERFVREVLNETGLRTKLRQKVPQIDRLESLDSLRDLTLTRLITEPVFMAFYEGIASSDLYPHVRANLIKKGVVTRNNLLDSSIGNKDKADEYEQVRFGISGNSIQVVLKAYNPTYQSQE